MREAPGHHTVPGASSCIRRLSAFAAAVTHFPPLPAVDAVRLDRGHPQIPPHARGTGTCSPMLSAVVRRPQRPSGTRPCRPWSSRLVPSPTRRIASRHPPSGDRYHFMRLACVPPRSLLTCIRVSGASGFGYPLMVAGRAAIGGSCCYGRWLGYPRVRDTRPNLPSCSVNAIFPRWLTSIW